VVEELPLLEEEAVGEELPQLEEAGVVEELPQLVEEAAGDFYEQYDAYDDEFNWCKYAWSNECYALCQRYDASVECHASVECYALGSNG
jgi:hypothetical protein